MYLHLHVSLSLCLSLMHMHIVSWLRNEFWIFTNGLDAKQNRSKAQWLLFLCFAHFRNDLHYLTIWWEISISAPSRNKTNWQSKRSRRIYFDYNMTHGVICKYESSVFVRMILKLHWTYSGKIFLKFSSNFDRNSLWFAKETLTNEQKWELQQNFHRNVINCYR